MRAMSSHWSRFASRLFSDTASRSYLRRFRWSVVCLYCRGVFPLRDRAHLPSSDALKRGAPDVRVGPWSAWTPRCSVPETLLISRRRSRATTAGRSPRRAALGARERREQTGIRECHIQRRRPVGTRRPRRGGNRTCRRGEFPRVARLLRGGCTGIRAYRGRERRSLRMDA